jgi:hypothetical protein
MAIWWSFIRVLLSTALLTTPCLADGYGFIGYGRVMHYPPCAHACWSAISISSLSCTPDHGPYDFSHGNNPTPPECFATNQVFMQTLALCISTHCPKDLGVDMIENFWALHETSGNKPGSGVMPAMSYTEALASVVQQPNVSLIPLSPLKQVSLIGSGFYLASLNAMIYVEQAEINESKYR